MKTLHILRSEPNDMTRILINGISQSGESMETPLYTDKIDYVELLKDIFENDQVISWW